ncbi:MAG TPA: T9SS type A sorting domain-containing protein [Bacteroidota bacterium]|nr:T9SS type A sorting domain-containing protein [Bacteroidota bacterium]
MTLLLCSQNSLRAQGHLPEEDPDVAKINGEPVVGSVDVNDGSNLEPASVTSRGIYIRRDHKLTGTYNDKIFDLPAGVDCNNVKVKIKSDSKKVYLLLSDNSILQYDVAAQTVSPYTNNTNAPPEERWNAVDGDATYLLALNDIVVSRDSGGTWQTDTAGIEGMQYNALAVDTLQFVYLATSVGVFKQHPDSNVWHKVTSLPSAYYVGIFVSRKNRVFTSTYGAVYSSKDSGNTWTMNSSGLGGGAVTRFGDDSFNNIYGLVNGTVVRSDTGFAPWVRIDTAVSKMIRDPINSYASPFNSIGGDTSIYLATNYGLFVSTDQGTTWSEANEGLQAVTLYGYARSATCQFASTGLGVYYENKGDSSWTKTFPPDGFQAGSVVLIDDAGNLYTLGQGINANNSQGPRANWKSTDNGTTWFPDTAGLGVAVQASIPIYFADETGVQHYGFTNAPAYIYKKSPGSSWTPDTAGLSGIPQNYSNVFASDGKGNLYWAITNTMTYAGLLYQRPIAGGTWVLDTAGLQGAIVYSISADKNGNLYAGTWGGGIYKKTGSTWAGYSTPNGLGGNSAFVTAVDGSGALWAGFASQNGFNYLWHGIYYTTDDGSTWNDAGLDSISVRALTVSGDSVYALTYASGLYILTKNVSVNSVKKAGSVPNAYALSQNYPNPFNPATMIEYQLKDKGFVTLTVFDVLGRRVATLVNGEQTGGTHSAYWDASTFASGVYFYRLKAGDFIETKKMLLMK